MTAADRLEVTRIVREYSMDVVDQPADSEVFVVSDLMRVSTVTHWAAVLLGKRIVTPAWLRSEGMDGPSLKFAPAVMTPRKMWISPECASAHPLIVDVIQRAGSKGKLKFLAHEEEFMELAVSGMAKSKRLRRTMDTLAIVRTQALLCTPPPVEQCLCELGCDVCVVTEHVSS